MPCHVRRRVYSNVKLRWTETPKMRDKCWNITQIQDIFDLNGSTLW